MGEDIVRHRQEWRRTVNRLVVGSNPTARATSIPRRAVIAGAAAASFAAGRALAQGSSREIRLGWPAGATASLAAPAARELGLFSQFGLEVVLTDGAGSGSDLPGLLGDGHVDAVVCPVSLLLDPLRQGLDARLTTGVSAGGMRLLAEKRARLRRIEDLKGKRIGVGDLRGPARLFFSIMLRRKGINPFGDVTWVLVGPEAQEAALRAGEVDAVAASDPQGFYLLRALAAVEVATNLSGSYAQRVSTVLACGGRLLRDRRAESVALTRAVRQAAAWAGRHPADAAALIARWTTRLDAANRTAMVSSEALGQDPDGRALVVDVAEYADELRLLGTFPYDLNAERYARSVCENVLV